MPPQYLCTGLNALSINFHFLPSLLQFTFSMRPTQNSVLIIAHLHLPYPAQIFIFYPNTYHLLTYSYYYVIDFHSVFTRV